MPQTTATEHETARRSRPRRHRPSRLVALGVVLILALGAAACSGDSGDAASDSSAASGTTIEGGTSDTTVGASPSTSEVGDPVPEEPTSTTSSTSPAPPLVEPTPDQPLTNAPGITTALYWVRPAGGEPRSLPGYTDPDGGPTPLLAYGSVTNGGPSPVTNAEALALWRRPSGEVALMSAASLHHPDGSVATVIEPGQIVDVWAIVDEGSAPRLTDLAAEFVVGSRP